MSIYYLYKYMSDDEKTKAIQGLQIISITLLSGIISAYFSNLYYNPIELLSITPAIGIIIVQLFLVRIIELPKDRGQKDDLYIILMTLFVWFISYTVILQV